MHTFGAERWLTKQMTSLGIVLGRVLGLVATGAFVHLTEDPWAVLIAGVSLGTVYGLSRAVADTNTELLKASPAGLSVKPRDGEATLIPWEDVGAIEAWRSAGGFSLLCVHVLQEGQDALLTVSQRDVEAQADSDIETFVPYCSRQAFEGRGRTPGAVLISLLESGMHRAALKRVGIDALLAGLVVAVFAHSWSLVPAAMAAFPLASTGMSLVRFHFRHRSYEWVGTSWTCRCDDSTCAVENVPKTLRLWLEG